MNSTLHRRCRGRLTIDGLEKKLSPFWFIGRKRAVPKLVAGPGYHRLPLACAMSSRPKPFHYPPARRSDHVDEYRSSSNGIVKVPDPYNWLEQSSPETEAWISAQISLSRSYLDAIPYRDELEKQFMENMDYVKVCMCQTPLSQPSCLLL
jgi:hypothetical protein